MALDIGSATQGRDRKGLQDLKTNLRGDFQKSINALTGSQYTTFLNSIENNWTGTDAEQFKSKFKGSVQEIKTFYEGLRKQVESILDQDASNFKTGQNRNSSTISSSVKKIS